jgi:hypothetical protein
MPRMKPDLRKSLLRVAMLVVALCGVAVYWFWYPSNLSAYATFLLVIVMLLLMKQAAKWQMFQLSTNFPIPQVQAKWDVRSIRNGLLCLVAMAAWCACAAVGIKYRLFDALPVPLALFLVLAPFATLLVLGIFFVLRGILGRNQGARPY